MDRCPICHANMPPETICDVCGYDPSRDYSRYPTFGPLPPNTPVQTCHVDFLRCSACGGVSFRFRTGDRVFVCTNCRQTHPLDAPAAPRRRSGIFAGLYHVGVVIGGHAAVSGLELPGLEAFLLGHHDVRSMAFGPYHCVVLDQEGTAHFFRDPERGPKLPDKPMPNVREVAAGYAHVALLRKDDSVIVIDSSGVSHIVKKSGDGSKVRSIAAGSHHTVVLLEKGTVIAHGNNDYGQCNVREYTGIQAVAAGVQHTVLLGEDGRVITVGNTVPRLLAASNWKDITAIAAGNFFTVGLDKHGTLHLAGYHIEKATIQPPREVRSLAADADSFFALLKGGSVFSNQKADFAWKGPIAICMEN